MKVILGPITKVDKLMNGISATPRGIGEDYVVWTFLDNYGISQKIKVCVYLVPSSSVSRLFSPQYYLKK